MSFVGFMSSGAGRIARIVAGLALIVVGALIGGWGFAISVVGLVPLLAGLFDVCLFGPVLRAPFRGRDVRQMTR